MKFDPLEPFATRRLLEEMLGELKRFEYKLHGRIPLRFYGGKPTIYEFDLNLGMMHFTERDFSGLSSIFARLNKKWGTDMTFCIYPSKKSNRDMILNVRGSPKAPADMS